MAHANANLTVFKVVCKPITRWAGQRALVGRNRSRNEPEKGRFTGAEVDRLLDQSWRAFDDHMPDVSREPTFGSRLNVRLAALTLAFHETLTGAGIERSYATELVADACWKIYQFWGYPGLYLTGLFPARRDPAKHVRPDGTWPMALPFNYPGYIARYVPTEKGIGFDVVRCPVAEYFRAHGAGDVAVGTWCALDYGLAEIGGLRLERPCTLAAGQDRCDFRWRPAANRER